MFIELIIKYEFRGLVPLGRICTPVNGYFYDKLLFTAKILQ